MADKQQQKKEKQLTKKEKHKWNFHIKHTIPDYDKIPGEPESIETKIACKRINAMCFLLDGIPYSVVYGPAGDFAQVLLDKLGAAEPNELNRVLKSPSLIQALEDQLTIVRDDPKSNSVLISSLYTTKWTELPAGKGETEKKIINCFKTVRDADKHTPAADPENDFGQNPPTDKYGLLCIPFLLVQYPGDYAPPEMKPIGNFDMLFHERQMGAYTLMDIYTKSWKLYPALAFAVQHGKSIGALGRNNQLLAGGPIGIRVIPPLNNRRCVNGTCAYNYPNEWCNVDANGHCTTGS